MEKQERQSNLELLRIISMMGVIVLHYNNTEMGGAFALAFGVNKGILFVLESIFICGVNVYMLISGYFLCLKNQRRLWRPVELVVQVMVFGLGFYILGVVLRQKEFTMAGLGQSLVPNNYFVILYIVCFLLSPYINVTLYKIGQKQSLRLMILMFLLFSVWPTAVDVLRELSGMEWAGLSTVGISGSQGGYTIVNFVMMYCMGAYLRLYLKKEYSLTSLLAALAAAVALLSGWAAFNSLHGILGGSAWEYCNPLVVVEAVILLLLFRRLHLPGSKIINTVSKGAFTVYLLHSPFLLYIGIPKAAVASPPLMVLHILLAAVGIYAICFLCYLLYGQVTGPLFRLLERKWPALLEVRF